MSSQREIGTYVVVTIVAMLIWAWAASETREQKTINYGRIAFFAGDAENWLIKPSQQTLNITMQGSKLAIENAVAVLRRPVPVSVPPNAGRQAIDLAEALRGLQEIRDTGIAIVSTDPATTELEVDEIERLPARVKAVLPGVQTTDEITIDPPEVILSVPSLIRGRYPEGLTVEAFLEKSELDKLEPGIRHTREVKLRLPESLSAASDVTMSPTSVNLSFTIRSRTKELTLEAVRVQLAGPPEDADDYEVQIEPKQLRSVTISADEELIKRIRSNEATVVAVLHLSTREKENRITSKPISYFMALVQDGTGAVQGTQVDAKLVDGATTPAVGLTITDRGR